MLGNRRENRRKTSSGKRLLSGAVAVFMLLLGLLCMQRTVLPVIAGEIYQPLTVDIRFECMEKTELTDGIYRIVIRAGDTLSPAPEQDRAEVKGGKGSFRITVTEPGSYVYQVRQEKGKDSDTVYDSRVYEVHILVMNKDTVPVGDTPELVYTMSVNYAGTDEKPEKMVFQNKSAKRDTEEKTDETTEEQTEKITDEDTEEITEETTEKDTEEDARSDGRVQTGDDSPILLISVILIIAAAGIVILLLLRRRNRKDKDEDEVQLH